MKKSIIIWISILVCCQLIHGQIPANKDFTNWDWQNQDPENWKMSDGSPSYKGGNVDPPLKKLAPGELAKLHGLIREVYERSDYTKSKGWTLIGALFGKNETYPCFVLYNKYRSIIRIFYYFGSDQTFSYAVATCSFIEAKDGKANPAVLSSAVPYKSAPDKYVNRKYGEDDILVKLIPNGVVPSQWNAVDFPLMFDPYYKDKVYEGATMVFKISGVAQGDIKLEGRGASGSDPKILKQVLDDGFTYKSSDNNALGIDNEQITTIKSAASFSKSFSKELENINPKDPEFLNRFKKQMQELKLPGFLNKVAAISSAAGGYLSAANFVIGLFGGGGTDPVINFQVFEFTGSIKTSSPIIIFTTKVPGTLPHKKEDLFDCQVGLINFKTTPVIQVTEPYGKFYHNSFRYHAGGYPGAYVKYKLSQGIELSFSRMEHMQLQDIKFAILCKPKKNNKKKDYYSITDKNIAFYAQSFSTIGNRGPVPNPVYDDLMKGRFVIHKYNPSNIPANHEIYFGTPYKHMQCLKDITFEVPEQTEVYLGVYALFTVDGFSDPIAFHAKYELDKIKVPVAKKVLVGRQEQPTFPFSDYYTFPTSVITLDKKLTSGTYETETIIMNPGFSSKPGFVAKAERATKCSGETKIDPINYNCEN